MPVPPAFDEWFMLACSRDPNGRFASATAMVDALRDALLPPSDAQEGGRGLGELDPRGAGTASPSVPPLSAAPLSAAPLSAAPLSAAPLSAAPLPAAPLSAAPLSAAPLSGPPISTSPLSVSPGGSVAWRRASTTRRGPTRGLAAGCRSRPSRSASRLRSSAG